MTWALMLISFAVARSTTDDPELSRTVYIGRWIVISFVFCAVNFALLTLLEPV